MGLPEISRETWHLCDLGLSYHFTHTGWNLEQAYHLWISVYNFLIWNSNQPLPQKVLAGFSLAHELCANDAQINQMTPPPHPPKKKLGVIFLFIQVYLIVIFFKVMGLQWPPFSNTYSKPCVWLVTLVDFPFNWNLHDMIPGLYPQLWLPGDVPNYKCWKP